MCTYIFEIIKCRAYWAEAQVGIYYLIKPGLLLTGIPVFAQWGCFPQLLLKSDSLQLFHLEVISVLLLNSISIIWSVSADVSFFEGN